MCATLIRYSITGMLVLAHAGLSLPAGAEESAQAHPLAIHMNQWLEGSREWSTPNPDYNPENPRSFAEYRVRWDWDSFGQQLLGKLFGVRADGSTMLFWKLYSTYNPVTRTVIYQQIGSNGAYIHGEHPARTEPVAFGEVERLDSTLYGADGTAKFTRHENVFQADGTHHANVYEKNKNGEWELANQWDWTLVPLEDVRGEELAAVRTE